jgi:hypothetical protein
MATIIGLDCELFHNSGSFATPTWGACDAVRDASFEISVNEVDASRRGSGGWRLNITTLKEATLNVTFMKDKDDTVFNAIEAAFQAGTAMELVVYDGGNASGSDGLDALWQVTQWNEGQDLEGVVTIEATFRVAPPTTALPINPTWLSDALPTSRS